MAAIGTAGQRAKDNLQQAAGQMVQEVREEMSPGWERRANRPLYVAAGLSILLSLLAFRRSANLATFIGLWAPTILGLGVLMKENRILDMQRQGRFAL